MADKKANMAYWDRIDAATELYVKKLSKFSTKEVTFCGTSYDVNDLPNMDREERTDAKLEGIMEIAKEVTEFATKLLAERCGAEFPYVDENY